MADIFLSYARADQPRIEKIVGALEGAGYTLWWDKHLRGGQRYAKDIKAAMEEARVILVAWSAASVESEWVLDEAAFGRDQDKLLPVSLDNTPPPLGFGQRQAIDLNAPDGQDKLHDALDAQLGAEHGPIPHNAIVSRNKFSPLLLGLPLLILAALAGWYVLGKDSSDAPDIAAYEEDPRKSVAVLPFKAQSTDENDQFFADGVTEEILNRLDALEELRVLPRTTVFFPREREFSLTELGQRLGVEYVVDGTLRRSGDSVRASAQLIRVDDNETLWSQSYDGTAQDVLQFQSDIAEKVATALDILLDDANRAKMQSAGIDDPEAFATAAKGIAAWIDGHFAFPDFTRLYEASQILDEASNAAPQLVSARIEAADIYSHIIVDRAAGVEHPELPQSVTADPRAQLQRRLAATADVATNRSELLVIEHLAAVFSDDWSRIPAIVQEIGRSNNECHLPAWTSFLVSNSAEMRVYADGVFRVRHCFRGDPLALGTFTRLLAATGNVEQARIMVAEEREAGLIDDAALLGDEAVIELLAGNVERGLELARASNEEGVINTLRAATASEIDELGIYLASDRLTPANRLALLAQAGRREDVNRLAAQIDARPSGPMLLQLVVDICHCGAPFDIEKTPNYAAMIEDAGLEWPFATAIKWPMKDW